MAVRRLDPEQPPSFAFTPENDAWARATIAKYPEGKQASAVIPLLWRAQEQNGGWTTEPMIRAVADLLGMAHIRVYEIATFYTMFQLKPVGSLAHIQVCGTTPCMLRGARDLVDVCKRRIAPHPHQRSADGRFSWEEVECLGSCANAPMVQVWKDTYEDLTPESFEQLIDAFAKGRPPKPGSLTGRTASCPAGGATSLTDPALFDGSGLDTRGVRKAAPGVTYFEIDDPGILAFKQARLRQAGIEAGIVFITGNYVTDGLLPLLAANGFDFGAKSYVIWEGNTMYLTKRAVLGVLQDLRARVPSLAISFDYVSEEIIAGTTGDPRTSRFVEHFAEMGAPWHFGANDIAALAAEAGMTVLDMARMADLHRDFWPGRSMGAAFYDNYAICTLEPATPRAC